MFQRIINNIYRYPISELKRLNSFGGYFAYQKMLFGGRRMKLASVKLPPVPSHSNGLPIYFLTGKKYLYQTLFCIRSLTLVSKNIFRFILVDDGSFDELLIERIRRQLPGSSVITNQIITDNLKQRLPWELYPNLRAKRQVYPHLKKLTDIHTIDSDQWKLVLDSDMLFWSDPSELITWLNNPLEPIHMQDCVESYGYSRKLMEEVCGSTIPQLLNVGVIGLRSGNIDWQKLEDWIEKLEKAEGGSYYLEQALSAMLIADQKVIVLERDRYKTNPTTVTRPSVLHHYVDTSKKMYFENSWKKIFY